MMTPTTAKTLKTAAALALAAANLLGCSELMADPRYTDGRPDAYARDDRGPGRSYGDRGGYDRGSDYDHNHNHPAPERAYRPDERPDYGRGRPRDDRDYNRDWDRRRAGLEKLGTVWARKEMDNDLVEVRGRGRYTALVFRVDRGDVRLENLRVTFGNDDSIQPEMKHFFREGERSYRVEFPRGGVGRDLKRVRFIYKAVGRGPAVIDVYGEPVR